MPRINDRIARMSTKSHSWRRNSSRSWNLAARRGKIPCNQWNQVNDFMSYMGVSKNMGKPPKSSILIGFSINYKPSIFGYPYFWKHLYSSFVLTPKWDHWSFGAWRGTSIHPDPKVFTGINHQCLFLFFWFGPFNFRPSCVLFLLWAPKFSYVWKLWLCIYIYLFYLY